MSDHVLHKKLLLCSMKTIIENFTICSLERSLKENLPSCVSFVHSNSYSFLKYLAGWISSFMYRVWVCGGHTGPHLSSLSVAPGRLGFRGSCLTASVGGFGFTFPRALMDTLLPIQFCSKQLPLSACPGHTAALVALLHQLPMLFGH